MSSTIAPLTNSQKLFLQRLLVSHVLPDDRAQHLYQRIKVDFADVQPSQNNNTDDEEDEEDGGSSGYGSRDEGYMGNNLEHCLGIINASLVPAFNLEVCTVSLPPPYNDNDNDDNNEEDDGGKKKTKRSAATLVKYHAVVNRSNDGIAQSHAFPMSKGGPHELAYFRLVIEKIVERGVEILENGNNNSAVGCPGALNRMELINLRTELEGAHKDKLTIGQTENALELLECEGWLVQVAPPADDDDDDDDDSDDDENENDEDEDGGGKKRANKRSSKRKKRPSSGDSRRKSLKGTFYGIGPRSFMELGEFLQKAGLPGDRMPQSILHAL